MKIVCLIHLFNIIHHLHFTKGYYHCLTEALFVFLSHKYNSDIFILSDNFDYTSTTMRTLLGKDRINLYSFKKKHQA